MAAHPPTPKSKTHTPTFFPATRVLLCYAGVTGRQCLPVSASVCIPKVELGGEDTPPALQAIHVFIRFYLFSPTIKAFHVSTVADSGASVRR